MFFKYLNECNSDRLNLPLIPIYATDIQKQIFQSNEHIYLKKNQFIFPIIEELWKTYHWKAECRNRNKKKAKKIYGSELYKKSYSKIQASSSSIKNIKQNFQCNLVSKKEIIENSSWKALSLISSKQELQYQSHSFLSYMDSDFKEIQNKIYWLFQWAKTYSLQFLDNDLLDNMPKLKIEVYPVQVLYCLYNLKMNFKFLSTDGKSYENNEKRKSVEIKTNERENEMADFSDNISVCIPQEEINVNFKSDLLIEEHDKKLNLCNSLKQSITSLKEQLNSWREKRLSIISNVHSTLNKTLIKDQNDALPEKIEVQLLNNENNNNDNILKSHITQNSIDSLQDQNSKNFFSSRVSKFLSLPKIKMKEFEGKISSECASSLTTVTKLTSENETSVSRSENHKSTCNKNVFPTSLRMAAVNSNGNYARQISFNDYNDLFTNVNNKTYTNIGIQTSEMETITNKDDELNNRENRLSLQEILTSTVQQTFRQELRNMAEQMGFRFIAGAIGCISMQSQLLSRNNYTSVNTQTETIETKILKSSKHHDLSFNSEPNDNQQNLLVNKKSDENLIKNKISENINSISNCVCMENDILRHTQNNVKTSEIFKNDKESDNMKYSLKSSHINEEEMDSGKEITPDILDESSAVEISVDSCVDNITKKKNPNLSFKIEEYVNKITSLPFGWTHGKNISEKFIQDKAPVFLTLNKKSKQMDKLHYQFLKIPTKTDIFTVPFKTQYELMSRWKVEVKSKNKYSDIRTILPDLLKSKSIKNENKKFPLLKSFENNYGPLLYIEEKKSNFNLQKNFINKPSKNISMKHVQDYLSKKRRSDKTTKIKNSPENLSPKNYTQITVNEIPSKTDKVLQDQYKKDEGIVKSTKDTVIIQTDQTYADIQYNIVSQLNLDIKKVDAATTANKIEFKNTETITDEDYFIDNSNIITRDFGIQTTLLSNKNDNFNKVSEKLPVYDDGFKNVIVNEELENIKRSIEEKQKQINNMNLKHILDSLIHEEEEEKQSMDNNPIIPHKNSEVNITNSELKIESKLNNENKFQNEINDSEILENNQIENNESGIIDDEKLETYNKSFIKCEDMKISSRNDTEISLNNTQDMPENIGINRSKEGLLNVGDKLTKEILDGNQKFVNRYLLHFDSDKEKYKIAAKEALNHRLVHMQEKLEEIEKVSNTMKKEINDAQKAVSTMELLDQNYLSEKITASTYLDKIQSITLPTAEIRKNNCLYFEVNLLEDSNKNLSIESIPAETLPVTQIKHIVNEQNMEMQKVAKQSLETVIEKNDLKRERQISNFDKRTESAIALLNELVDDKNIYHIKETQLIKDDFKNKSTKHQLSKKLFNSKKTTNKNLKQTKLLLDYQPSNFARKKNFKYSLNNTLSKTMKNKISLINKTQSYMRNSNFEKTDLAASNLEETFVIKSSEDEDFNKVQQKALQSLRKLYDSKYIPLNAQIKYMSKKQNTTFKINSEGQSKIPMKYTTELMKHTVDENKDKNQTFVLKNEKSDSSDNISLWSVPDDIKKILYDSNTTDFNNASKEVSRLNEEEISIKSDISSLKGN